MNSVICFGEALIDFLNFNQCEEKPLSLNEFRQYPGGAPANVAVAIAKLGGKARFAGQVGNDTFGDFLQNALEIYQVDTKLMSRHASAKTALAFVTLDDDGDRSFTFFREGTADILFEPSQITDSWFSSNAIFHLCSNTLTTDFISNTTKYAVAKAKSLGRVISFDVNLRHNLWQNQHINIERVNHLSHQADVLKYSKDELIFLSEGNEDSYIAELLANNASLILVTDGPKAIHYYCKNDSGTVIPPNVKAVDTTAGGDAFIGAFLFGLSQQETPLHFLSTSHLFIPLIEFSSICGAYAVTQPGAFPALPILKDVEQHWINSGVVQSQKINIKDTRPKVQP